MKLLDSLPKRHDFSGQSLAFLGENCEEIRIEMSWKAYKW
jgi:hypothetical protein